MKWLVKTIPLAITVCVAFLLITGSPLLVKVPFPKFPMPLGNMLTALGMFCLPLSIYVGFQEIRKPRNHIHKGISYGVKVSLLAAAGWIPIAYFLSGNLTFSFYNAPTLQGSEQAMQIFWTYNTAVVCLPLLSLLTYFVVKRVKGWG